MVLGDLSEWRNQFKYMNQWLHGGHFSKVIFIIYIHPNLKYSPGMNNNVLALLL
jgi:hypothetical protein